MNNDQFITILNKTPFIVVNDIDLDIMRPNNNENTKKVNIMKATIYGNTHNDKEYKKELVVTDCGIDWFEFEGRWKMERGSNDTFNLISPTLKFMAKDCYIELS